MHHEVAALQLSWHSDLIPGVGGLGFEAVEGIISSNISCSCLSRDGHLMFRVTAKVQLNVIFFQPKLLSYELLDLVSSHFNLKEKEFFGLAFLNDKYVTHCPPCTRGCSCVQVCHDLGLFFFFYCSGQRKWLQMDRRVLDHDFSKKAVPITLSFLVRY